MTMIQKQKVAQSSIFTLHLEQTLHFRRSSLLSAILNADWHPMKTMMKYATTLKSAAAASSRNGTRIYLILLCHFMTQNEKFWCRPETFRLSFMVTRVSPKKFELLTYPSSKDPGGKFWFKLQIPKICALIELIFLGGHPRCHKSLKGKYQDCTALQLLILCHKMTK